MRAETTSRSWGAILFSVFLALLTTSICVTGARVLFFGLPHDVATLFNDASQPAAARAAVDTLFTYDFKSRGVLMETGSPDESSSPYWWLDSGAKMIIENEVGKTVQGSLPALDRWRLRYSLSSPEDTEGGYAPQNLFRLLTRSKWDDVRVEGSFRIVRDNFTESPNRNGSNGLLLLSRYEDSDNFYYAGVRVDGHAVIKKKYKGTYYTMAEKQSFGSATLTYKRGEDMNLLPHQEWLSLRSETVTTQGSNVSIKLFMRAPLEAGGSLTGKKDETQWTQLLSAVDNGRDFGTTTPITNPYPVGIRTDFMDVEFDNFKAVKIRKGRLMGGLRKIIWRSVYHSSVSSM